ncbi:MAG: transposase [Planctomycetaceae bacterium]|nr:transposase [Planctomycetaceae bacterium]
MRRGSTRRRRACTATPTRSPVTTCSGCGKIFEHLSLSDRWISCDCGTSLDRDHNAAINILRRGRGRPLGAQPLAGGVCPEATLL